MADRGASSVHDIPSDPARAAMVAAWRRRSAIVAFWRRALPFTIFVLLLSMAGWIVAHALLDVVRPEAVSTTNPRMTNPRFYGRDNNARAYLLSAAEAVRDLGDQRRYVLTQPAFNLGGGKVSANEGVYIQGSSEVVLRGDVVVLDAQGGRMETQEALIDTRTGVVTNARSPNAGRVQIDNDMGAISADDYTISKSGEVTFRGRVRGVINPN